MDMFNHVTRIGKTDYNFTKDKVYPVDEYGTITSDFGDKILPDYNDGSWQVHNFSIQEFANTIH